MANPFERDGGTTTEDNYIGQTYGPAGMGMNAYVNRPETQPTWVPDISVDFNRPESNVRELGQTHGPVGSGITSLGENYVPPPWWETQMGGKAYGPFHKSGPDDYSDMFKLQPGENYSYNDLIGNRMLNPHDYFFSGSPYKRDNPLMQATQQSVGSEVPDHLIYDNIYDDEGNLEGYSWNPYKEENYPLINEWLPDEYSISPGVTQWEDIFQFRDFPWMEEDTGGWLTKLFKKLGPRQGLGRGAWMAPLGTMSLEEWD